MTMKNELKQGFITAKVSKKVKSKRVMFDNVEHLVVPVIAAKQTVMNGILYVSSEFTGWEETWNGIPVPVNHPQVDGVYISAKIPLVHEQNNIGWFYNVKYENDKLKGDIFINIAKADRIGHKQIVDDLEAGKVMEVSIGVMCNLENTSGEYEGENYQYIARNMRPDHLALLPNDIGACSVEKGCGTMRVNCGCGGQKEVDIKTKIAKALKLIGSKIGLSVNDNSFSEIQKALNGAIQAEYKSEERKYAYVVDIYDNYFIYIVDDYQLKTDTMYKRSYATSEQGVKLGADTQEVIRKISYSPVIKDNSEQIKEVKEMNKKEDLIKCIITNTANQFTEEDSKFLETCSEDQLKKMVASEAVEMEAPAKTADEKVQEALNSVEDTETKEFLENAVKAQKEKKAELIQEIVKNSKLTQEEIKSFSLNQLEKLASSVKPVDYSARGGVLQGNSQSSEYKQPSIFDEPKKG